MCHCLTPFFTLKLLDTWEAFRIHQFFIGLIVKNTTQEVLYASQATIHQRFSRTDLGKIKCKGQRGEAGVWGRREWLLHSFTHNFIHNRFLHSLTHTLIQTARTDRGLPIQETQQEPRETRGAAQPLSLRVYHCKRDTKPTQKHSGTRQRIHGPDTG